MNNKKKEFEIIVINPNRCVNCETCMEICSFVHETEYIPLNKKVIGARNRIELELAISCDLCKGMKDQFIDPEVGRKPQCIDVCPHNAIFVSTLEASMNESRMEAIHRCFNQITG